MKRKRSMGILTLLIFTLALLVVVGTPPVQAQQQGGSGRGFEDGSGQRGFHRGSTQRGFIDEDGDGINDRCVDTDGDGIPNGKDPDYLPPRDGTGRKVRHFHRWEGDNPGGRGSWGRGACPRGPARCRGARG